MVLINSFKINIDVLTTGTCNNGTVLRYNTLLLVVRAHNHHSIGSYCSLLLFHNINYVIL